jgi:hypothetical protein
MQNDHSLVIDPGSRTFDWLVAKGMHPSHKRSHSIDRGASHILQLIADDISEEIKVPYTDLEAIDLALRTGKSLTVYQKTFDMRRMRPMVEIVVQDAVAAMMNRIGAAYNVQHVILVGGGAFLFRKAVKATFSYHQILTVKDPVFDNVRGYQIAGTGFGPRTACHWCTGAEQPRGVRRRAHPSSPPHVSVHRAVRGDGRPKSGCTKPAQPVRGATAPLLVGKVIVIDRQLGLHAGINKRFKQSRDAASCSVCAAARGPVGDTSGRRWLSRIWS